MLPTVNESKKIFDSPEVRVVEASAGSGKTFTLAKRYVQLILNSSFDSLNALRCVLAITFTNKTAFEMKGRILEFLKTIALDKLEPWQKKELLLGLPLSDEEAQQSALAVMEDLIRHYNYFQVKTIDEFINTLLSGCAFKMGLTANFKIKRNSLDYLTYSLDELVDESTRNASVQRAFDLFLHNYLKIENRSGWFPKKDMLRIICSLFEQQNRYALDFVKSPYQPEDIIRLRSSILKNMKNLFEALPEKTNKAFEKSLGNFLRDNQKGFDVDNVPSTFKKPDFPINKSGAVDDKADMLWSGIRDGLKELCEMESVSLFDSYVEIYYLVEKYLKPAMAKDDVIFLGELNKKAGVLFDDEQVTVPELYYRLATRLRHYLIDEFQDTSRLQWKNIAMMVQEALSTGGSLFYVGDRKQAIYDFRGGDVKLFDDVKKELKNFNLKEESLTQSWRSHKAIVEFNNFIFSPDNLDRFFERKEKLIQEKKSNSMILYSEQDVDYVKEIFSHAKQSVREGYDKGYVYIEHIDEDKKEERNSSVKEKIIGLIAELKKRYSYKDIAVLTRGNDQVEILTNWLLQEGIAVDSERTSNIRKNTLIEELINFLTFLDVPIDNVSFAKFIQGRIFLKATGLDIKEIQAFLLNQRVRTCADRNFHIYREFRLQYPDVWEKYLEKFFKNIDLYPLYELVVSIYGRFECLRHFPDDQGFFMHFLELVKKAEQEHRDAAGFLEYFDTLANEDLYVQASDSDAVRILTIHKSKGLEFPVVIIPFLEMKIEIGEGVGEFNQKSYILDFRHNQIHLLKSKKSYRDYSENHYEIYAEEYKKELLSELNMIYVALTRPKNELYAFYSKKTGNKHNLLQCLMPEGVYESGSKELPAPEKKEREPFTSLAPSVYHDWIDYLKDEFLDVADLKHRERRFRGRVFHFFLSFVHNLNEEDISAVLEKAQAQAQNIFEFRSDIKDYGALLKDFLETPALKPFFYTAEAQIFNEMEAVDARGHSKRIDRLIVKEKEAWVIDYKSSSDDRVKSVHQVCEYMKIISDLYPEKKIKGFLIYFDSGTFEEIYE